MTAADWVHIIDAMKLEKVKPQDVSRNDPQWTKLWDERWNAVENWWRSYSYMSDVNTDTAPLRTLLTKLQEIVPIETIMNGIESLVQHAHPNDVPAHIKGAAKILFQGELECVAKGDRFLQNAVDAWASVCVDLRSRMQELLDKDEVTQGDETMSRHFHAEAALQALKSTEMVRKAFLFEDAAENSEPDETDTFEHLSAELAHFAFSAGVHARLALGKELENWALLGQSQAPKVKKRREDGRLGGLTTSNLFDAKRQLILRAMARRIELKPNVRLAAKHVYEVDKLGKSTEANRSLWYSHLKKLSANKQNVV